ncbi:MAG TPA: hypothetical protein VFB60_26720 [Ktedonobacteraceae bacterium]|nr:hypothetical protein [Ktedonobacteraceae bacterium]
MAKGTQQIFRAKALEQHAFRWEKTILPRVVAPRFFLFLWILLGLLLSATFFAWLAQVPMYATGTGIVLAQGSTASIRGDEAVAAVFLPATPSPKVQAGATVLLSIGSTIQLRTTVLAVQPAVMSPNDIRQRYLLSNTPLSAITEPSRVVFVGLGSTMPTQTYAGSLVSALVQVGTRRVLSLLPGFNQLIGE